MRLRPVVRLMHAAIGLSVGENLSLERAITYLEGGAKAWVNNRGWSIRSFAQPEEWGRGNRAERLRAEVDFGDPASDGHQTGLAVVVLSSAGVPPTHPAVQRGLDWLRRNQRQSGRWWTRSLNTETWHFITYTGTLYPVMALAVTSSLASPSSQERLGNRVGGQ